MLENSERSVRGVRMGKSGPLERTELANQIQGFRIPDRWDVSEKIKWVIICLARWTESRAVIGYPNGQDGAILPARDTGYVPQGKSKARFPKSSFLVFALKIFSATVKDFLWFLYRLSLKTRKLNASTRKKTKETKKLTSFMNLFCNKNRQTQK